MSDSAQKVEFALGSQVSEGHFFKSSFARSFVVNCNGKDTKSLDYDGDETESTNNFYSLVNFANTDNNINNTETTVNDTITTNALSLTQQNSLESSEKEELERLRKQCQQLEKNNQDLQKRLSKSHQPAGQLEVIDTVCLQNQISTLQWQLKQSEATRHMYHSLLEQVSRFLERCRKSMDMIHERSKASPSSRVPRSRSVHAVSPTTTTTTTTVHNEVSAANSCASSTTSSSSSESSSRMVWSTIGESNKTQQSEVLSSGGLVYRRPKQKEIDPDDVPPEKLSQEAFRLMRTVQSLLTMREPDLSSSSDEKSHCLINKPLARLSTSSPRARGSLDAASLNSASTTSNSSKMTEDEETTMSQSKDSVKTLVGKSFSKSSTPNGSSKRASKDARRDKNLKFKEWALGTSSPMESRPRPAISPSNSAEDESGFSSLSSFQEVGLPIPPLISPIKGCHTEIGLPNVPPNNNNNSNSIVSNSKNEIIRHRRWSSTPAEYHQTYSKRHSGSFTNATNNESMSVWV